MSGVEELYKQFGILADAKEKAGEHEGAFLAILAAVKGSQAEKRLASQFIARFFKYFPKLQENAIDAMLDLCEDEDNMIRRQAIKGLPDLCKDTPEHLPRIADVLTQLLQSEDPTELTIVKNALTSLFKMEPKGTIGGLFSQILNGEEVSRESAINFLSSVVEEYGKVPTDADVVDRFLSCARQALPYFVKGASAQAFFSYIVESILPKLNELVSSDGDDIKLEMLKLCAEISPHGLTEENEYMPLPPGEEEENKTEENAEPKLQFSCSPGFLTDASAADRLKDFRLRLSLQGKTGVALQEDENKIKIDLFHNPPSFKSTVTLSWKTPAKNQPTTPVAKKENTNTVDEKRKRAGITPITFDLPPETKSAKKSRGSTVTVYTPPGRRTGASNGVLKGQSMPNGNRGRGGFRGRNRSRGRGWRGGRF
ncbi:Apoptosis inhibitor 5-A [Acropora cervicornis]|uniref:Apoptosis inhibitor 5-A n=1 Tax=Acropora cervicornis TaxID=6130 RepID=A0AAD9QQZ9_ACRCE|nr:Apoptosis inhibitor 5-A [Acropora cervicornis]